MKEFLSNIKTKAELTEYSAERAIEHSTSTNNRLKKFIVTFGTESKGNVDVPRTLVSHCQEEADTLLSLHALTIDKDAEVVIDSPDTDVLLVMFYMYPLLPSATVLEKANLLLFPVLKSSSQLKLKVFQQQ